MLSTHTSCRCLDNARVCLGNTRASLHDVAAMSSSISTAHGPWRAMGHVSALEPTTEVGVVRSQSTCVSAGSLLSSEVGSGAEEHMAALDPSWMVRGGVWSL
jgi:hypothetical protein